MNNSTLWKLILTALVTLWGVLTLFPATGTEFDTYIRQRATQKQEEFKTLLERADAQRAAAVAEGQPATLFTAIRDLARAERIDLSAYFDIPVQDITNLRKRNDVLLAELLKQSAGKLPLGLDLQGGVSMTLQLKEEGLGADEARRPELVQKAIEIIRDRVDGLGVSEPVIRSEGSNRIVVQLAGVSTKDNPDAWQSISAPARLSFHLVHRTARPETEPDAPAGYVAKYLENDDDNGVIQRIGHYIQISEAMGGDGVAEAFPSQDQIGNWIVSLRFTEEGGRQFAAMTKRIADENQSRGGVGQLAIVLDDRLYSAPTVREEISGGSAQISGRFTQREVFELANALSNPLSVGLEVVGLDEVSATLAEDARSASLIAALVAGAFVFCFMAYYYRWAGAVAGFCVALNLFLVGASLAGFGAVLTLPGVAGLVLVIGMGVDGFILIFERMREELQGGKNLRQATLGGFDKAFSAILDSNITTLLTALVLIWLGTGPVKGFGVTLSVGIVINMFCILIVGRALLELLANSGKLERLFPLQGWFKIEGVPFMDFTRRALLAGAVVAAVGVLSVFIGHKSILGTDFTGGDEITLTFKAKPTVNEIDAVAAAGNFGDVNPVFQRPLGQDTENLVLQTRHGEGRNLFDALAKARPDAGLDLIGETQIGASVGREIQLNALYAVLASFACMLLYVALRFEFGYGLGAVGSLAFTGLVSVALFIFCGMVLGLGSGQLSSPMIAAVLMVIGYAINDAIVVFDRIREELVTNPNLTLRKVINLSINATLSRTVLTGISTIASSAILVFFASGPVVDFALLFTIGVVVGTFSSIFVASPLFYAYHKGDRKHVEASGFLPSYEWEAGAQTAPANPQQP